MTASEALKVLKDVLSIHVNFNNCWCSDFAFIPQHSEFSIPIGRKIFINFLYQQLWLQYSSQLYVNALASNSYVTRHVENVRGGWWGEGETCLFKMIKASELRNSQR